MEVDGHFDRERPIACGVEQGGALRLIQGCVRKDVRLEQRENQVAELHVRLDVLHRGRGKALGAEQTAPAKQARGKKRDERYDARAEDLETLLHSSRVAMPAV